MSKIYTEKELARLSKHFTQELTGKTISHVTFESSEGLLIHFQDSGLLAVSAPFQVRHYIPDNPESEAAEMEVFIHALENIAKVANQSKP